MRKASLLIWLYTSQKLDLVNEKCSRKKVPQAQAQGEIAVQVYVLSRIVSLIIIFPQLKQDN